MKKETHQYKDVSDRNTNDFKVTVNIFFLRS